MKKTIIIGCGDSRRNYAKLVSFNGNTNVSESNTAYLISPSFLGYEVIIFKDTEEGRGLRKLIDSSLAHLSNSWIDLLVIERMDLANIEHAELRRLVQKREQESYERGRKDMAAEIEVVLQKKRA